MGIDEFLLHEFRLQRCPEVDLLANTWKRNNAGNIGTFCLRRSFVANAQYSKCLIDLAN